MVRHRLMNAGVLAMALFAALPAASFFFTGTGGWGVALWGAKLSAFLAFGLLVAVLALSSRCRALEQRLGGLDAVYLLHHMAGMAALFCMMAHPILLAVAYRSTLSASSWFLLWSGAGTILGTTAFLLAAVLVLLSICHWLPYQAWITTHRGMGVVLVLSALHVFGAGTNVHGMVVPVLYAYLAIGAAAYVYKVFLYPRYGPSVPGVLSSIFCDGGIIVATISLSRPLGTYMPGQFAYVSLHDPSVPPESHPFSIVRQGATSVVVAVAPSGDYTRALRMATVGSPVRLYGPYGAMHRHYLRSFRPAVWIAGGIGITPFVSLWHHAAMAMPGRPIALIWSVRGAGAPYLMHLVCGSGHSSMSFVPWNSRASGRLTGQKVADAVPFGVAGADIMLCGPNEMMYLLSRQLIQLGVPAKNIYYETFSYRD